MKNLVLVLLMIQMSAFAQPAAVRAGNISSSLGHAGREAIAAGFKGVFTCSGVFVARRSLDQIMANELLGFSDGPAPIVNYQGRYVSVPYKTGLPPTIHAFRTGMGCTTLPLGQGSDFIAQLPYVEHVPVAGDPSQIPWPVGDLLLPSPLPAGVDPKAIDDLLNRGFDGATYGEGNKTIGIVIVYRDRIVAERYAHGFDVHVQYRTWSAAKSIASALIGILSGQGRIHVEAPAPIPEWQQDGDPRKKITIEHLLEMSSGLESGGSNSDEVYWLGGAVTGVSTETKLEVPPGSRWKYANNDTLLLMRAARHVIGNDYEYLTFPQQMLFNRIGMRDTIAEIDHAGNYILSSQVFTTARDLARFALLYLHDGVWRGERILPEGWVAYSVAPASMQPEGGRGYAKQWWLLDQGKGVPPGTYTAAGARGQLATVVPGHDLVIVRRGIDPFNVRWNQEQFVVDTLAVLE